tara:strand:+ start:964 stop:1848 length:885 start_codon:yes stop_codon:yes gene_type:complete
MTNEVRFDGRPFEYRRPTQTRQRQYSGAWVASQDSYEWLNPLYKYSEGQVTDAARKLGISNVNRESEVTRILEKIRNPNPVAAPAPAAESNNNTQNNEATPATINNTYADEIDNYTPSKPAAKDFITRFGGNTDTMAHSGMAGVRAAEAAGYSIAQIQQMGIDQGISFGSGAQTYFNQQGQKSFDDQLAAIQQQNAANLQQLTIDQNTRLDKMAADQQRRSDELAAGQRTYQQNQARSGQLGALQIGGAAETPRTGGTQGFKRRKLQINPVTANALAGILVGTAGSKTTNALNV